MRKRMGLLIAPLAVGALGWVVPSVALAQQPASSSVADNGQDLGPTVSDTKLSVSIVLKIQNKSQLENYIQSAVTPGNPHYHKYLSVNQFVSNYAPSNGQVNQVVHYLQSYGLTVDEVYADNLVIKVSGTVDQLQHAFSAEIHDYSKNGKKYHAPKKTPVIPAVLSDSVLAVAGFSTEPNFHPMTVRPNSDVGTSPVAAPTAGAAGVPGQLTVSDAADLYKVTPLYKKGITGKGQTIGIATLANFDISDAYHYWDAVGVKYSPNRISQVHVDGGGDLSSDAGSGETTLDVEQSGGLAPDANIKVYDAPNTDAGFMDVFYKAVSDNTVNTLSVSWGAPEAIYLANGTTNQLEAMDQAFMEGAAQGISMFAASGDSGAYDTNRALPYPYFSKVVGADAPSSDPYITAAGGTTLPTTLHLRHGDITTGTIERAWGWDYFNDYLHTWYGDGAEYTLGYFSIGGGGAVSSVWGLPWYQQGVSGLNATPTGQSLIDYTGATPVDYADLPSGFAGRNAPDLSMNADPETGYLVYSSTDGGWIAEGGTSFVAPQLNGITALMNQYAGASVGFLNPTLYSLAKSPDAYGPKQPFNDITTGDNWYYNATSGYDNATGIGTPNVEELADAIRAQRN